VSTPANDPLQEARFLPGQHAIEAYGAGGFRFADMSHRGSILALPSGIRAWAPGAPADITVESLAHLFAEPAGEVEFLVVGMGVAPAHLSKVTREALRAAGIRCDSMATGAAVSTYNILLGERRRVAGAFLATP
jgi:uncharacterized protein